MYSKFEVTRKVFGFWIFQYFITDEFFIGPFETNDQRKIVMRRLVILGTELFLGERLTFVCWRELEALPAKEEAINPYEATDAFKDFLTCYFDL